LIGSRPLVLALSVALVAALSGCGDDGGGPAAGDAPRKAPIRAKKQQIGPTAAELYKSTCSACHGPDARGIAGMGKNLTTSELVDTWSTEEFVEFLKVGRETGHPLNTTGIAMPPRGGNPALTDGELRSIAEHVKDLPSAP
jgi:disulfide bond formation protein DsbB